MRRQQTSPQGHGGGWDVQGGSTNKGRQRYAVHTFAQNSHTGVCVCVTPPMLSMHAQCTPHLYNEAAAVCLTLSTHCPAHVNPFHTPSSSPMGMLSMHRRPLRVSGIGPSAACMVCRSVAAVCSMTSTTAVAAVAAERCRLSQHVWGVCAFHAPVGCWLLGGVSGASGGC